MIAIKAKFKDLMNRLIQYERSSHRLALSASIAIFIAFSPFLFFHTIMIVAACWVLRLNFVLVYGIAHLINNPWTMVAIYGADHWLGHWLLSWFGAHAWITSNPFWIEYVNHRLATFGYLPTFSLWSFLIGGSLLAVSFSIIFYPLCKRFFSRLLQEKVSGGTP